MSASCLIAACSPRSAQGTALHGGTGREARREAGKEAGKELLSVPRLEHFSAPAAQTCGLLSHSPLLGAAARVPTASLASLQGLCCLQAPPARRTPDCAGSIRE